MERENIQLCFLDKNGLEHYHKKIKEYIDSKAGAQLKPEYLEYLEDKTYAKPTVSFDLIDGNDKEITTVYYAVGDTITIKGITYSLTNTKNIQENSTLTLSVNNEDIETDIPTSSTSFNLTNAHTETSDTKKTVTYTLSGTNSKEKPFSHTITKYFVYPFYYGGYSQPDITAVPVGMSKKATGNSTIEIEVTLKEKGYIHIITSKTITKIKNAKTGFEVPYTERKDVINMHDISYNDYHTVELNADTYKYTITFA